MVKIRQQDIAVLCALNPAGPHERCFTEVKWLDEALHKLPHLILFLAAAEARWKCDQLHLQLSGLMNALDRLLIHHME
ncbi:hypothetical protein PATA110616_23180 [Paenibacillus tarimensis]